MKHSNDSLNDYKRRVDAKLAENMQAMGSHTLLHKACQYALASEGKRLRPAIVFMVGDALGHNVDLTHAALAIEFFHTASLAADDLPCMDDDDERRNRPSLHKAYNEATALLVSYALIASGYGNIAKNAQEIKKAKLPFSEKSDQICVLALENAAFNTGLNGATGGQFLDLFPPDLSLKTVKEVIHKKTGSLFEIAFIFGWLFGGGDLSVLPDVKKAAAHFGLAFQIADDLGDAAQDAANESKINVATLFGKEAAEKMYLQEVENYLKLLKKLKIHSDPLRLILSNKC